ncbi:hypothetical protein [Hymenobacter sp. CRA2]|uniref:hypothetical protein n=1 Tax=Hymenobacter sp. CRA2 TaxID=1955620 RepID=UPI00098F149F|nr:hypothetical protein [Hymenobacter sp. CRA2]OON69615.1 hypothetical protein B0919_06675 [Hymenobacter sp. CRA2]
MLRSVSLFALATALLFSACSRDETNVPRFKLTEEQKQWSTPYRDNAEWRFDAGLGYQRVYRAEGFATEDFRFVEHHARRATYYREQQAAQLQRVDSVYQPATSIENYRYFMPFELRADVAPETRRNPDYDAFGATLVWHNAELKLPLTELANGEDLPTGWTLHPTYTVGGISYTNVLEFVPSTWLYPANAAYNAVQVFYSRERGVLQFKERGGTVWTRR